MSDSPNNNKPQNAPRQVSIPAQSEPASAEPSSTSPASDAPTQSDVPPMDFSGMHQRSSDGPPEGKTNISEKKD